MKYFVDRVNWPQHYAEIKAIREQVFVYEFQIPQSIEFDQQDQDSIHVLLRDTENKPIATGRLCKDGRINRVAVVRSHRRIETAREVIRNLLDIAKSMGFHRVLIDSNLTDVEKYEKCGFKKAGTVYMDVGIAKQPLACPIDKFSCIESILH